MKCRTPLGTKHQAWNRVRGRFNDRAWDKYKKARIEDLLIDRNKVMKLVKYFSMGNIIKPDGIDGWIS